MARVRGSSRLAPPSGRTLSYLSRPLSRRTSCQLAPIEPALYGQLSTMDPTRPTPAVCIGTDVYGRLSKNNAPSDFVTSRGSDDGDTFQSSSSRELAALRFEIPKDDIPKVADSVTGKRLQTCRRRAAFDLEWPLTPSPESVPATPVSPCKRRATDLHNVTRPYLSGDFAAGNLPPAPNEANERRRARKYEPEIEQDIQSRKKLLAISFRRNKLPTAWDESSFTGVRYKDAVAGKAKGKDTLGARPPPHHQSRRVVGSPVYHINDGGGLEDVPAIQLEDRFRQGPTSHEVGMPPLSFNSRRRVG